MGTLRFKNVFTINYTREGIFTMDYKEKYNQWVNDEYFDEATRNELKAIADDDKEIQERFYKDLEFGTGGLRSRRPSGLRKTMS